MDILGIITEPLQYAFMYKAVVVSIMLLVIKNVFVARFIFPHHLQVQTMTVNLCGLIRVVI